MRIAYCDDELIQATYLTHLIEKWSSKTNTPCTFTVYQSAEELLFENPDSFPFDFMILDIQMKNMNGIELAKKIRDIDEKIVIAFLSNRSEYVFDGYEVQAIRYLLKPIKEVQLFPLLELIQDKLVTSKQYLIATVDGEKIKIDTDDIFYIESISHYICLFTKSGNYEIKRSMNDIYREIKSCGFISSHRSFIVNLKYIDKITKTDCILANGQLVPISRNSYKQVNEAFIEYYKGGELL